MKKLTAIFLLCISIIAMTGCVSTKKVSYFQNIDSISLAASKGLYNAKIMPKDQLSVTVSSSNYDVSAQFNQVINSTMSSNSLNANGGSGGSLMPYLVDNNGDINFPIIGKIHVQGLTREECQDKIQELIKPYFAEKENPIVLVRFIGYRVTVMGEVNSPKVIEVPTERITILEALTDAGDLTLYGKRENILLIREDATGEKHQIRLNLNDANIINSPYYYLQQNDVVYVEPNKVKARNSDIGTSTTLWLTMTSAMLSIASIVINIFK